MTTKKLALIKKSGVMMRKNVLSTHKTKKSAEQAMREHGGAPGKMFNHGLAIVDVGPKGSHKMKKVHGKMMAQPRATNPATAPAHTQVLSTGTMVAIGAGVAAVGAAVWYFFFKPSAADMPMDGTEEQTGDTAGGTGRGA